MYLFLAKACYDRGTVLYLFLAKLHHHRGTILYLFLSEACCDRVCTSFWPKRAMIGVQYCTFFWPKCTTIGVQYCTSFCPKRAAIGYVPLFGQSMIQSGYSTVYFLAKVHHHRGTILYLFLSEACCDRVCTSFWPKRATIGAQ